MARSGRNFRKQRTREHIIADQSLNHVEKFIIDAGYTALRIDKDYGYDLIVSTYNAKGFVQTGHIYLQLKASQALRLDKLKNHFAFRVDRRDHDLWRAESMPVILVLYDAGKHRAYWLHVQQYFEANPKLASRLKSKTATVHVPKKNAFTKRTARILHAKKTSVMQQMRGKLRHGT